jgi:hypothetical protein
MLMSTDRGINWTVQSLITNRAISDISCRNNRCIIIDRGGNILTTDNINNTDNTQPLIKASVVSPPVCEPISYYDKGIQRAHLWKLEIPLFDTINLYSATLELASLGTPSGSYDRFRVKELTFQQTVTTADPCHAVFMPNTGILTIPTLRVTEKQTLTCAATLQQSLLQPDILSLIEYACHLP